jgi:hypothetical protein
MYEYHKYNSNIISKPSNDDIKATMHFRRYFKSGVATCIYNWNKPISRWYNSLSTTYQGLYVHPANGRYPIEPNLRDVRLMHLHCSWWGFQSQTISLTMPTRSRRRLNITNGLSSSLHSRSFLYMRPVLTAMLVYHSARTANPLDFFRWNFVSRLWLPVSRRDRFWVNGPLLGKAYKNTRQK